VRNRCSDFLHLSWVMIPPMIGSSAIIIAPIKRRYHRAVPRSDPATDWEHRIDQAPGNGAMITLLGCVPWTINPPIITLSPICHKGAGTDVAKD